MRISMTAVSLAVLAAFATPAAAQIFVGPPPPPFHHRFRCAPWGCPPGYRGLPLYYGGVWFGGAWIPGPLYYRDWYGRRQYWLQGGWQYAPPPWHRTRRGDETDYDMPGDVLFPLASAHISEHAYDVISDIARDARQRPHARVIVEGYTDTSGGAAANMALSEARARAVADVLARHGVSRARIETRGFGETHLAVPTGDGVREAKNRRVVIRIVGR